MNHNSCIGEHIEMGLVILRNFRSGNKKSIRNKEWAFLSNHGKVFGYLARHPENTIQAVAQDIGLSMKAVHNIIDDLERDGYLECIATGKGNRYMIHPEMPVQPTLEEDYAIGELLESLLESDSVGHKGKPRS